MSARSTAHTRWRVLVATALMLAPVVACFGGAERSPPGLTEPVMVAGGGTTGIYYGYGAQLATALAGRFGVEASVIETGGSIENLQHIAAGRAVLGFSAADAAADAVEGRAPFDQPLPVQAIARVYDDFVHLVVPADSDVWSITDLQGRTVSLGAAGSGTELIAGRILNCAKIGRDDLTAVDLGIDGSIAAIQAGEIDAFFWSGGLPTPGVSELAEALPIRLVGLTGIVEEVRSMYGGGYRHGVVPQGTYRIDEDVATMAVPNMLMVHQDAGDDLVYGLVDVLFDSRAEIAIEAPAAALLDRVRAIHTEPVELHPGAVKYYRDTKP